MVILDVKKVKIVDLIFVRRILLFEKANKPKLNHMEIQTSVLIM
jgi:hypothetical protein